MSTKNEKAVDTTVEKRTQVSVSLDKDTLNKLTELRWELRCEKLGDVLRLAADELIRSRAK